MMDVFVHPNDGQPKLWAADVSAKKVVFGSLVNGGAQERSVSGDLASKIREKFGQGYADFGRVETTADAVALIWLISQGKVMAYPPDPAGIIQCSDKIIRVYPWMEDGAVNAAMYLIKKKIAETEQPEPEEEPVLKINKNLSIIVQGPRGDEWDLVI